MDEIQGLVLRAQAGDRDAFGELYERLAPRLFCYFYHRTSRDVHLAEDLSEEVFLKILERLDQYRDRGVPFVAWLMRIARNHLIDHYRTQPGEPAVPLETCHDLVEDRAERTLERLVAREVVRKALRCLTREQREVLELQFLHDLSVEEIAQRLGRHVSTIRRRQERALRSLACSLNLTTLPEFAA